MSIICMVVESEGGIHPINSMLTKVISNRAWLFLCRWDSNGFKTMGEVRVCYPKPIVCQETNSNYKVFIVEDED